MTITPGHNQGIPMGSYTPSTGGGGGGGAVDNAYTKEETDALLNEKQDLLNASNPLSIGTTTIGEPNNITIVNGKITPAVTANAKRVITSYASDVTSLEFYGATDTTASFVDLFKEKSYFDIPINFSKYFTDDYTSSQTLSLVLSGMTNAYSNNSFTIFAGQLLDNKFKVYVVANIKTITSTSAEDMGHVSIATSVQEPTYAGGNSTRVIYNLPTSAHVTGRPYTSKTLPRQASFELLKLSSGKFQVSTEWYSGTHKFFLSGAALDAGTWQLSDLQSCNVIRVVFNNYSSSYAATAYLPTSAGTYVEKTGDGVTEKLDWSIEGGIVKTYGISLKLDDQTVTTNDKGELTVNMDDLSGRVTAIETNMGGLKLQKLTQAEYDALDPKDENTMYLIVE